MTSGRVIGVILLQHLRPEIFFPRWEYLGRKIARINELAGGCVAKILIPLELRLKSSNIRTCAPDWIKCKTRHVAGFLFSINYFNFNGSRLTITTMPSLFPC